MKPQPLSNPSPTLFSHANTTGSAENVLADEIVKINETTLAFQFQATRTQTVLNRLNVLTTTGIGNTPPCFTRFMLIASQYNPGIFIVTLHCDAAVNNVLQHLVDAQIISKAMQLQIDPLATATAPLGNGAYLR